MKGFENIKPKINNLKFPNGKIEIYMEDGRILFIPLKYFPSIKKLNIAQRKKWSILDGIGFLFEDSDEIFHLYQILGNVDLTILKKPNSVEGFLEIEPKIKNLKFPNGRIEIYLEDGRIISVPLKYFPSIKKLTMVQRKKWGILDGIGFDFEDCDELFHLYHIMGKVEPPCC